MSRIIYTAKVVDTNDPESLGRVKVKLLGFGEDLEMPWLRIVQNTASVDHGSFILPEVDDEVVLIKGSGDSTENMIILGVLYNGTNKPAYPAGDGENNLKLIRTREGNELIFDDTSGAAKITIQSPESGDTMIELDQANTKITIFAQAEIMIEAPDTSVTVSSNDVIVEAANNITVEAATNISLEAGAEYSITGGASVAIAGPMVEISGDSMVTISGGMVQIN